MHCSEPCSSECIAMPVWNCWKLKQAIVDEWWALSQKFIDRSINEWRRLLRCVVQQNGTYIEHLFQQLFSRRLYTAFLLQFIHICELYSFIDLLCKLHIYTHAVLRGATYRSTVKSSRSCILVFVMTCRLCIPKIIRVGQRIWKVKDIHGTSLFRHSYSSTINIIE